jgi:hypothetical protein
MLMLQELRNVNYFDKSWIILTKFRLKLEFSVLELQFRIPGFNPEENLSGSYLNPGMDTTRGRGVKGDSIMQIQQAQ